MKVRERAITGFFGPVEDVRAAALDLDVLVVGPRTYQRSSPGLAGFGWFGSSQAPQY
jgi:hypothetical protein